MSSQGYDIKDNIIYQDNQSAIKMERNGRMSSTGRSRHINIRYFWVKDLVDNKMVKIEYCPTEHMLADFFTKPLNGYLFQYLRSFVMGYKPMCELQRISAAERKSMTTEEDKNEEEYKEDENKENILSTGKIEERVGEDTFLPVTSERKQRKMTYSEAVSKGNTRTDVSRKMQYGILYDHNNKQNNKITRVQSAHNNN